MMLKTFGLVTALVALSSAPAFAASVCSEPIAPAAVDGTVATQVQMNSALDDVKTFIKQSDDYQTCLYREYNQMVADATKDKKPVDPAWKAAVDAKVQANQDLKVKVGSEFNTAAVAFNAKHPK